MSLTACPLLFIDVRQICFQSDPGCRLQLSMGTRWQMAHVIRQHSHFGCGAPARLPVNVAGLSNIDCTESLDVHNLRVLFTTRHDQSTQQNDHIANSSLLPTNSSSNTINGQVHRHHWATGGTSPCSAAAPHNLALPAPNPASHDGLGLPRHRQARGVKQQHDPIVLLDSSAFKPQTKPSPESIYPRHLKSLHGPLDISLQPQRAPASST